MPYSNTYIFVLDDYTTSSIILTAPKRIYKRKSSCK